MGLRHRADETHGNFDGTTAVVCVNRCPPHPDREQLPDLPAALSRGADRPRATEERRQPAKGHLLTMSYLLRVLLPDVPGSLGQLAEALGLVEGNIQSVDVVSTFPDGTAMDDNVVSLPPTLLPDSLISAAEQVDGVQVDSIRPFSGTVDRRGQIEMLALVARHRRNINRAMTELVTVLPRTMTSGWGVVVDTEPRLNRIAASQAAPEDDGSNPQATIGTARVLDPDRDTWIPDSWALLDSALAATPIRGTSLALVVGRPGGPDFLASEVEHLGHLGDIIGSILK